MIGAGAPDRANWEVIWLNPKTKKLKRTDFGHNFQDALALYIKAKGKRKLVTLRCKNFGFAPPEKYHPRTITFRKPKVVNGRPVKSVRLVPMKKLNREGIYWCPYCMEMRKFKIRKSFLVGDIRVYEPQFCCPVCGISTKDHNVRKWNPEAVVVQYQMDAVRTRAPNKTRADRKKAYQRKKRRRLNKEEE